MIRERRRATEFDRAVRLVGRSLFAGTMARTIPDRQHFAGVCQRDHQRVITPLPVVGDVPAGLALAGRDGQRAVPVEERLVEELWRLPLPDVEPRPVDRIPQLPHAATAEPPTEISRRGRIGNRVGSEDVEEGLVVPPPLDVLQTRSLAQGVHRQVQDRIRLIIRTPPLENRHAVINGVDQSALARDPQHQRHATVHDRLRLVRQFVLQSRRAQDGRSPRHHPLKPRLSGNLQTFLNPSLATRQLLCDPTCVPVHSKSLRGRCAVCGRPPSNTTNHRGISSFFALAS